MRIVRAWGTPRETQVKWFRRSAGVRRKSFPRGPRPRALLYWNAWGVWMALAAAVELGFALWVFVIHPERPQNRRLAGLVFCDAVLVVGGGAILYSTTDVGLAYAAQMTGFFALSLWYLFHVRFLATLDSPFARPLRSWGQWLVAAFVAWLLWSLFATPDRIIVGFHEVWYSRYEAAVGPVASVILMGLAVLSLYGLLVTVSALRGTRPGSLRRRQAKAFALGFLVRDGILLVVMPLQAILVTTAPDSRWLAVVLVGWPLASFATAVLLGVGMLRSQLFGFDLQLKWALKRGTLAGIFLAVFFLVTVPAENYLTSRYGWAIGGAVAGLLLFAIAPLQRLSERVAHAALPHVDDTEQYRDARARELYAAAWEAALKDGVVTDKERDVLAMLQEKLGLTATEALAIERGAA